MPEATTPITFEKATKTKRKARIALIGYEGVGKTYTGLVLATALAEHDQKRIALADSEGDSALIYADRFDFDHARMTDHSPAAYEATLRAAVGAGYGVLFFDSLSHEWIGTGGALEMKDNLSRNSDSDSFRAWGKVTPAHNKVFMGVVNAPIHIIASMRQKKAYVVEQNEKGKNTPRLIGTEAVQREGAEYEFDLILHMEREGNVITVTKSRYVNVPQGFTMERPDRAFADRIIASLDEGVEPPPAPKMPIATDDLTALVSLGKDASQALKDRFYNEYLPSLGYTDEDVKSRWSRFVREGGVYGNAAVIWWREQTTAMLAEKVGDTDITTARDDATSSETIETQAR